MLHSTPRLAGAFLFAPAEPVGPHESGEKGGRMSKSLWKSLRQRRKLELTASADIVQPKILPAGFLFLTFVYEWSGFDIRCPQNREPEKRMSILKLH